MRAPRLLCASLRFLHLFCFPARVFTRDDIIIMPDKAFVNRKKRDEFNFSEANSEKLSATKFAASSSLLPELRLPVKNFSGQYADKIHIGIFGSNVSLS